MRDPSRAVGLVVYLLDLDPHWVYSYDVVTVYALLKEQLPELSDRRRWVHSFNRALCETPAGVLHTEQGLARVLAYLYQMRR